MVVIGLGAVWILDGLEATIVGSISDRLTQPEGGLGLTTAGIGLGGSNLYCGRLCGFFDFWLFA